MIEENIIVDIEKLSSDGSGIAHYNGQVIFVEKTCPKDKCEIQFVKKNKNFAFAKVTKFIKKSPYRIEPFCPMQNVCGACQIQFIDYKEQLKFKKQIVEDAMRGLNIEINDVIPSPQQKEFRHKIQYPIRQTQVSKRILAGYFKQKSHDILNIKYCPIQPAICDEIIEFIRENAPKYKIEGYDEKLHKGLLRHVVMRVSSFNNKILISLVLNSNIVSERIKDFAQLLFDKFDDISGITVNLNNKQTNMILSDKTILLYGNACIKEKILDITFDIGTNTFFQVNPKSAENIFRYVKDYISSNFNKPVLLDAYAGIGAFGFVLANNCSEVVSVEEVEDSIKLAKKVKRNNNIENISLIREDTELYLKNNDKYYDITVLDPPRKGCTKDVLNFVYKYTKSEIIYVSCNPATLARDLKYLVSLGGQILSIQPFDMFCHTSHIENVAVIKINKNKETV